jgi:O-antigen/teichoic acid export membrane protein
MLTTLVTAGVGTAITKYIAEDKRTSGYLTSGLVAQTSIAGMVSISAAVLSLVILPDTQYSNLSLPLVIVSLVLIPYSISMGLKSVIRGLEKIKELGALNILEVGFKALACIALIYNYRTLGAIFSIAIGSIAAILPAYAIIKKTIVRLACGWDEHTKPQQRDFERYSS